MHRFFSEGLPYTEIDAPVESMMHVVKKKEAQGHIKPFFELFIIEGMPGNLKWEDGKMIFKNQFEVLFYHLIHFKNLAHKNGPRHFIPGNFTISPTRIYHAASQPVLSY